MRRFFVALLANLIVFGLAFVVVLVVGEVLARRIAPATPRTYAPSPTRGWKPLPHLDITWRVPAYEGGDPGPVHIRTDANGFRMGREVGPKAKGVFRIALLGDSFTFGASVHEEHLYANVLERALRGRTSAPVEVVNLGVPGYGVHQEHATLLDQGFQVDPDLVVVALYLGNDLQETLGLHRRVYDPKTGGTREAPDHRIVDGRMVPIPPSAAGEAPRRGGGFKGWLRSHLRLYAVLSDRVKENPALRAKLERLGLVKPDRPRLLPPAARAAHLWNAGTVSLLRDSPPALDEAWRKLLGHLDSMAALCRERGIPMAVVVIPYRTQVVPASRKNELTLLGLAEPDLDLERPGRTVRAWGEARGVPVIDLLPAFRAARDPGSLYFRIDTHWNDKGHEAAGHALADLLVARRLVPAKPR
jgi:hypothetical protein